MLASLPNLKKVEISTTIHNLVKLSNEGLFHNKSVIFNPCFQKKSYLHQALPILLGLGAVTIWAHLTGNGVFHNENLLQGGSFYYITVDS